MKITVEVDVSPKELREFFGLPDISGLQADLVEQVRETVKSGAAGIDPLAVMKPFIPGGMKAFDNIQKSLLNTLKTAVSQEKTKEKDPE